MTKAEKQFEQVQALIVESSQKLIPCCLCGHPTNDRGLFIPNNSKEWGAVGDKTRFFIYPICIAHSPDNDQHYHEKVEYWIRKQQQERGPDTFITTA